MNKQHVDFVKSKIEHGLKQHADEFGDVDKDDARRAKLLRGLSAKVEKYQAFFTDLLPSEFERDWARVELLRIADAIEAAQSELSAGDKEKRERYRSKHVRNLSLLDGVIAALALGYQPTKNTATEGKEWVGSIVQRAASEAGIHLDADTFRREILDRYAAGIPARDRYFSQVKEIYRKELELLGEKAV